LRKSLRTDLPCTYDNALALIAFLSTGDAADAERAKLLADSLVWAQQHDELPDGRIRSIYYADNLAVGTTYGNRGNIARHSYDKYGNGVVTGNMAWAMLGLLHYYQRHGGDQYKNAALRAGQWIHKHTYSTVGTKGYTGGIVGWEPNPESHTYKSTEHNIDVYVAFMKLYEVTGDPVWRQRAMHAKAFVDSMWVSSEGFFYTGTRPDGVTPNTDNFPVDVMPWAFLAMGEVGKYGRGLAAALVRHGVSETNDGHVFQGVDFNQDKDGIWWEGTAHMVTAWLALHNLGSDESAYNRLCYV